MASDISNRNPLETKFTHTFLIELKRNSDSFASGRYPVENKLLWEKTFELTENCQNMSPAPKQTNSPPARTPLKIYQSLMRQQFRDKTQAGDKAEMGNQNQGLAVRYLNQISALVMLLEQMPLAPDEFALDILSWTPESRDEREIEIDIENSADHHWELVSIVEELQTTSIRLVKSIRVAMESGELGKLYKLCEDRAPELRARVVELSAQLNSLPHTSV